MSENKKSIEEMLEEVDGIIDSLESGDIPLEDSFKIYEKGMKAIREINGRIDKVEKKIIELDAGEKEDEA
ncbi:MAG: exodeoxyribonuclease VII small subunit [Lachnospiraceae bacterium]|nr:exodeoxyribonuclease VII small subunit [Candidatus Darwinimomas equi]